MNDENHILIRPGRVKDLTGNRYGRLVVIGVYGRTKGGKLLWKCRCDCGNIAYATKDHLGRDTNSCGCLRREVTIDRTRRHGETKTRLHNLWCSMRQRCGKHGSESKTYHEKGIKVCDEWNSYEAFRDWALANGYDPKAKRGVTTIDRIDNDKGYSPDNCRFVTQTINARNKSNNVFVFVDGERMPLTEVAEKYGVPAQRIRGRLYAGWCDEDAVKVKPWKGRNQTWRKAN